MPIRSDQLAILRLHLEKEYVPHLPPLLKPTGTDKDPKKDVERSLAAFALDHICGLTPKRAARAVVDDFDDFGIDAIHYDRREKRLYFVQAKLKATETFKEVEALAFAQGVRKIVNHDFSGFNDNVIKRQAEITDALGRCSRIEVVVAHTGTGIMHHASAALQRLLDEKAGGDPRLCDQIVDFDAKRTVDSLHSVNAVEEVQCRLRLDGYGQADEPRTAYYGTVALSALAALHTRHGKALYQKNIRTWLGRDTPVNAAIQQTLASKPDRFQYLNNGVTALCAEIEPKGGKGSEHREFELSGFSIINGAQTVASTANYLDRNPTADISAARVMLTLIKADADGEFGKDVTRGRNYQNDVKELAFAALDEEQERIRRELDHLDIEYVYRVGEAPLNSNPNRITVAEAIQALAMLETDPRYPVWMKRSLPNFLKTDGEPYGRIFSQSLSSIRLVSAVRVHRYIHGQVNESIRGCWYDERAAYKHGEYAMTFVFAKRFRDAINNEALIDSKVLPTQAGALYDGLRQQHWEIMQSIPAPPGPLSISKNEYRTLDVIRRLMTANYGLGSDPALGPLRAQNIIGQPYQVGLFNYLASRAPQITGLT